MAGWLDSHPKVLEIRSYGFSNILQIEATVQTYFDLTEVKQWDQVTTHPCHALQLVYMIAGPMVWYVHMY